MPFKNGVSVEEARETLSTFLEEAGCYAICARCPVYPGGEGCCQGCPSLMKEQGCGAPNLSCLTYTCGVLNAHLSRLASEDYPNKLTELTELIYGLPREGYRGCERRSDTELLQITNPLALVAEINREEEVFSPSSEEK